MAVFKCKMCGGALNVENDSTVAECEFCGTKQTLPKGLDDKRANLYDRANHFRRNNEYDKATAIYEQILNEDGTDAEAYWSLVLCRFGIEYVEDPATRKRVPTVNRAQFSSVLADENYKAAIANADGGQRAVYEAEAKEIDRLQREILAISQKEEPFDVFICYKETDKNGRRTPDSVLAQELYYGLKDEGFKVFFARITLEDKLGVAYEPYIFAALNSSKVMVVLGTKAEYFNAVWVKNEWSRYLGLIKEGKKKILIPAYKDMDPYDIPEEFSHLQAQDMSKLGFMQDLIRGIKKIAAVEAPKTVVREVATTAATPVKNLLKRAQMFLSDGDFESADEYCEKTLDQDPENGEAYMYKLFVRVRAKNKSAFEGCGEDYSSYPEYKKALRYGSEEQQSFLRAAHEKMQEKVEARNRENERRRRVSELVAAVNEKERLIANRVNDCKKLRTEIVKVETFREKVNAKVRNGKIGAMIHLGGLGAFFFFLIFANLFSGMLSALCGLIAFGGIIAMMVGMILMLKSSIKRERSGGMVMGMLILMIFYDIVGILFSILALVQNPSKATAYHDQRTNELNAKLAEHKTKIEEYTDEMRKYNIEIQDLSQQ